MDLARCKVCKAALPVVESLSGQVITYLDITFRQAIFFRIGGVCMLEWGMDVWLHSIQDSLLSWMQI